MAPSTETTGPPGLSAVAVRSRHASGRGALRLGSISGFEISLDYSWFIIFFVILATFTGAVFPGSLPGLGRVAYLVMGVTGTLLFFTSLLLHELAHSFVARAKGIEVEGITLFIFGGMARTASEASSPGDEFVIAGVGPLASFVLAALFYGAAAGSGALGLGLGTAVVAEYLGFLNLTLAIFNLLPGFPLDGGRLLRATLWKTTGSLRRATRTATRAGRFLGWGIIALGIYSFVVAGGFIGGLWLVFIGWFLANAARASYQQVLLQDLLRPLTAREAMSPDPETVSPDLSLDALVHEYFLRRPYNSFPVVSGGLLLGLITLGRVKQLPREDWQTKTVADIMAPLDETLVVGPETPMTTVLERMRESETRRALVAHERKVLGIISGTDITQRLDRVGLMES